MKKTAIQLVAIIVLGTGYIGAQDIPQSKVPSVVINSFIKEFPKARDVEWELKGNQYNVEFEVGFFTDFEAWFTNTGSLIRYTENISSSKLPEAVKRTIKSDFPKYRIDDAEKITENNVVTYRVELEKRDHEVNLIFSENGIIVKNQNQ
ncbi:MAG TPA: PepSY-like domain-containing protein [Perlabentimonas sp.]|nr:PepSY-like domain-containing protein [Perlabentimonas sp.]